MKRTGLIGRRLTHSFSPQIHRLIASAVGEDYEYGLYPLEPEELVDVGSQVSGQIVAFGVDESGAEVDYCSPVTNGTVLARIDDVTYLADLDVAKAQFAIAEAAVASARANATKAEVDLERETKEWERAKALGVGIAQSQSDYDAAEAAYKGADAQLGIARASVASAVAQVVQAKAAVENGVLRVAVAKRPENQPRRIEIG